jgi:hypothetical protein
LFLIYRQFFFFYMLHFHRDRWTCTNNEPVYVQYVNTVQYTSWHSDNKCWTVETKTHSEMERYADLYRNVETGSDICIMDPSQAITPLKPLRSHHFIMITPFRRGSEFAKKRLLDFSSLSFLPHGRTVFPLTEFSWNIVLWAFTKICR